MVDLFQQFETVCKDFGINDSRRNLLTEVVKLMMKDAFFQSWHASQTVGFYDVERAFFEYVESVGVKHYNDPYEKSSFQRLFPKPKP